MWLNYIIVITLCSQVIFEVRAKCIATTAAAQLEDDLRKERLGEYNNIKVFQPDNVLQWNCSEITTESFSWGFMANEENTDRTMEASQINTKNVSDDEPSDGINTYALVFRNVLQPQGSLGNVLDYDETLEEEEVTRSPGVVTDVTSPQLRSSSGSGRSCANGVCVLTRGETPKEKIGKILLGEGNGVTILSVAYPESLKFLNYSKLMATSIDRHQNNGTIFLAGADKILSTGETRHVVTTGVDGTVSLTVDGVHDKIYWMSARHQAIEVSDLDGTSRNLLVDNISNVNFPNNIVVDPNEGHIFFVANHTMHRMDLNGKALKQLHVNSNLKRGIKCLSVNTETKRVFFAGRVGNSTGRPYVASCDYEGNYQVEHLLGDLSWTDIYGLDMLENDLYFLHYSPGQLDSVWTLNLRTAGTPKKLYESPSDKGGLWSLKVYELPTKKKDDTRNTNVIEE